MKDRLKELRKALKMTQAEFADKVGIKRNTVATYEIGRSEPIDPIIFSICQAFNVNEHWLRTGEGEMFQQQATDDELEELVRRIGAEDKMKRRFATAILKLDEEQLEKAFAFMQKMVREEEEASGRAAFDQTGQSEVKGWSNAGETQDAAAFDEMTKEEKVEAFRRSLDEEELANAAAEKETSEAC